MPGTDGMPNSPCLPLVPKPSPALGAARSDHPDPCTPRDDRTIRQPATQPPNQAAEAAPDPAPTPVVDPQVAAIAALLADAGKTRGGMVRDNLIPGLLTAALVAVMIFAFTGLGDRITSLENRMTSLENRITSLENRIDARFAAQDAKIDALDAKIDAIDLKFTVLINEINLKLTALIAALNKTDEVDAALVGEITAGVGGADTVGTPPLEP